MSFSYEMHERGEINVVVFQDVVVYFFDIFDTYEYANIDIGSYVSVSGNFSVYLLLVDDLYV